AQSGTAYQPYFIHDLVQHRSRRGHGLAVFVQSDARRAFGWRRACVVHCCCGLGLALSSSIQGAIQMSGTRMFDIRPIRQSDYDGWRVLWDGYNAFYGRSGPTALPEEITRATWERFFDSSEPVHAL